MYYRVSFCPVYCFNIEIGAFVFHILQLLGFPFHISLCLSSKQLEAFLIYGQEPTSLYNPKIIEFQLCENEKNMQTLETRP